MAAHVHALYVHGTSPLHRAAPQCKLAATVLFVLVVVATPREALWAFGAYAVLVAAVAALARLSPAVLARRLVIELPFLAFAVFLPMVGGGERVDVVGLSLSVAGLWAAWGILAKGTLGVAAAIVMAATTPIPEILHGLERLRLPRVITAIAGFMVRYLDVTVEEARRMAIARQSRGHDPRWLWQARATAASAGTLFIRSFERGERVHLAMVSRGYDGTLPSFGATAAARDEWAWALAVPALAATVGTLAWWWLP
ncbi:MAG: cobalt ECF transporter T component CbiQ [Actinobacteria bacterium]|nr:cobalt ECF transporter T component CbiQ [Actinomycetota bacterium]